MTGALSPACATRAPSSKPRVPARADGVFEATETKREYHHLAAGPACALPDRQKHPGARGLDQVRGAPTFGQLAPGFVIDDDEATFGNPDLKPLESSNLDLGIEHFMGRAGTVSAFVFYKDIKNFVYNTDVAGTGAWTNFSEAHTYANGDSAKLYGLELAYSQKFDWLPAPWNGLLIGANSTFSRSSAGYRRLRRRQRRRTANATSACRTSRTPSAT